LYIVILTDVCILARIFHNEIGPDYRDGYEFLAFFGITCLWIGILPVGVGIILLLQAESPMLLLRDAKMIINYLANDEAGHVNMFRAQLLAGFVGIGISISVCIDVILVYTTVATIFMYIRFALIRLTRYHNL